MKKYLLGAAAALAIAAPGVASAQSGYADLGYSTTDAGSNDIDTWQLGGAYAWGGNGSLGFQLDGVIGNHEYDTGGDADTYNLGAHLFTRNDSYLLGGFVSLGNTDFGGGFDYDYYTVGVEGAYYLERTTFNGALSYSDASDLNADATALDLGVTHFVTDNFSFGGTVGFGELADNDFTTYGVGAEYQFSSTPISLYAGYTKNDYDGFETDTLSAGVRWNFGGSLLERDRSGASLTRNAGFGRLGAIL
ncbi:hypothetical protein [Candidatus Viadribacter manganicus]|uniref:Uncharacterized protein n=1 Tax=Candidatus Viadribacter manganicus TaxID=1759059 RepID=A0A1B1AK97_9PROT|nr:hypothetical protein [Candidatus Viadribacter manganicus]ANP46973.1 hypothetical protein ATE48_14135 [Candidatus Viadribacter manganicus]